MYTKKKTTDWNSLPINTTVGFVSVLSFQVLEK